MRTKYRAKCQYSLLSISYQACHFLMCVQYPICPTPISNGWDIHLEYTSHLTTNRIQRKKSEIQQSEMCKMKSLITARNSDWTTDNAQQNVSFSQSLPWMAQHFVWLFTNVKKKIEFHQNPGFNYFKHSISQAFLKNRVWTSVSDFRRQCLIQTLVPKYDTGVQSDTSVQSQILVSKIKHECPKLDTCVHNQTQVSKIGHTGVIIILIVFKVSV